jgi:hypothetical protein
VARRARALPGLSPAPFHGGVVLLDLFGHAPRGNQITSNELIRNHPNVVFDGSGNNSVIADNHCVPHC